ncbi:MAG: mechanosensitive ion channel [Acidobacteriota bacterium]|jgi:small-conductance mechanosensitive channel|nr:mechanosensitive ion channel [Acidobacteriota bacterium]
MEKILESVNKVLHYTLFKLNQTPVSLASILMFILVVAAFYLLSRLVRRILSGRFFSRMQMQPGSLFVVTRITHYLIMTLGAVLAFQFVGINLSGLAVIFGLFSVGIGFGLQNVTSNFIAGLILLVERPISIGDRVTIGDTEGNVKEIKIRSTTIQTLNNISYIVPNSEFISSTVINWSLGDPKIRLDIPVGVAYHSEPEKVREILIQVARDNAQVLKQPRPRVLFHGFGDSALNMELQVWVREPREFRVIRSDINFAIFGAFRAAGIQIPFPQRDVHIIAGQKRDKVEEQGRGG